MKNRYVFVWFVASVSVLAWAIAQEKTPEREFSSITQVRTEPLDVGVLFVAWQEQDHKLAEKLGQVFKPVVEAVASGSKLTKADAAKVQQWFESIVRYNMAKGESVVLLNMQAQPDGDDASQAGDPTAKQTEEPCKLCGSKEHTTKNHPYLDIDPIILKPIPVDTTLGPLPPKPKGGRLVRPQRFVVVLLLGDITQRTIEEKRAIMNLVAAGVEEARTSPSRLVIKTKSTPP